LTTDGKNRTTKKSGGDFTSSNMKDTINFSDLLEDVTFIPDISNSEIKNSNENLRQASYINYKAQ
jgi:hypothetical protein